MPLSLHIVLNIQAENVNKQTNKQKTPAIYLHVYFQHILNANFGGEDSISITATAFSFIITVFKLLLIVSISRAKLFICS